MEVCRNTLNLQVKGHVYHKERLSENVKAVYLGNWIFSYFVKQYFEVFWDFTFHSNTKESASCTHLKLTVQWYNLFPLQFTKASSSISLSPTPTQFSLPKWLGNAILLSVTLCPSSLQNALYQQWNLAMRRLAKFLMAQWLNQECC